MAKNIKKFLKSFTLIELIIVIAIIAVLGASAFLLLTQWMSKGRDAQRISDLSTIKTALDIGFVKNGKLPIPDEKKDLLYSGTQILYQGKFGKTVVDELGGLNKIPTDRTNGEYDYSLVDDEKTYMVRAIMENQLSGKDFLTKVNALDQSYKFVGKQLKGIIIENKFIYLPSMFAIGYVGDKLDMLTDNPIFEGTKPGQELTGLVVENDDDAILAALTGMGISLNDASQVLSQAKGETIQVSTIPDQPQVQEVKCGTSNGLVISSSPTNNLCAYGTASTVSYDIGKGKYSWTCSDDISINCKAYDDKNLVLMHFDNDITDVIGNSVTKYGGLSHSNTTYKFGSGSLQFDGSDDYITVANNDNFNIGNSDFTIDFWIKTTSVAQDYILSRSALGSYLDFAVDIGGASSPGKIRLLASNSNDNDYCINMMSSTTINDNQWHHVAMIREGTIAYLYIDGVQRGTDTTATCNINVSTSNLYIGKDNHIPDYNRYVNGFIDEFRFSKIARYNGPFTVLGENY
ncbi:MAG: LamG domain-containing protein [Candidatus Absconditabacteria bacterium]